MSAFQTLIHSASHTHTCIYSTYLKPLFMARLPKFQILAKLEPLLPVRAYQFTSLLSLGYRSLFFLPARADLPTSSAQNVKFFWTTWRMCPSNWRNIGTIQLSSKPCISDGMGASMHWCLRNWHLAHLKSAIRAKRCIIFRDNFPWDNTDKVTQWKVVCVQLI